MLEIKLIGTFDIKCDGKPVIISSRAAQSLFAYLILSAGTLHRREKLAGIFWPDATEEKARAYLRHELWRIRKALPPKSKVNYLFADDINTSFISSAEHWLDVTTLENISMQATAEELMNALSVFHGELLPGFYEDWVVLEREHLQAVYEQKISQLLDLLESEQRWAEILDWAERWISFGQKPEAAYRYLMTAYDALGDRAKAASAYERCVQALRALDLEPSEQTRALAFKRASKLNIPIPLTSFIGRETEIKEVAALLSKSRLVTLTGSGGVGKTRLAIQVVAEVLELFPNGVWFIDFAPLSDPALVPSTLANLLGLRESGNAELSITDFLTNYFRSRTALIVFDNCEHLIEASSQLADSLLQACQNLHILVTSREAFRIAGEISYRVPSLEIPKSGIEFASDALARIESVRLFTERAGVASPGFAISPQNAPVIAQICKRLDGIPLAIELAAARVNVLTTEQILKRLDDRFNLLTDGLRTALPRHQTLRAMIEWSYDLLSEKERILFRRLAVFKGGWTVEAAEEVCYGGSIESSDVLDLLSQLVNKSLVLVETAQGETRDPVGKSLRYRRLETIRQYAREKLLETSEIALLSNNHLDFFLRMANEAAPELIGTNQSVWLHQLEDELANLRVALDWSVNSSTVGETGLKLGGALWRFWQRSMRAGEGRMHLARLIDQVAIGAPRETLAFAQALTAVGALAYFQSDYRAAKAFRQEALEAFRKLIDAKGIADSLHGLGNIALSEGKYETARSMYEESLAIRQKLGQREGLAGLLSNLGLIAYNESDFTTARVLEIESQIIFQEFGNKAGLGFTLNLLGNIDRHEGDLRAARRYHEESIVLCRQAADRWGLANALNGLADVTLAEGDLEAAYSLCRDSLVLLRDGGAREGIAYCLESMAAISVARRQASKSVRLFGAAASLRQTINLALTSTDLINYERNMTTLHSQLVDTAFNAAWEEGRMILLDHAIEYALSEKD